MAGGTIAEVEVREADFDLAQEYRHLCATAGSDNGACVLFSGLVREHGSHGSLDTLELEHYPGMTEANIAKIIDEARARWQIGAVRVIHRVGRLVPSDQIVLVGVACRHRGDAFAAGEFIMDYLKTRAPIWKKESTPTGSHWVESRDSDRESAARWGD